MSKKKQDTHKVGNRTGYELIEGKYHLAPMYVEMFERMLARYEAVEAVLAAVTAHCQRDYEALAQDKKRLWATLRDDFDVDFKQGEWKYDDGNIVPVPKKEDK